jgi:hypothetical protein
MKKLLAAIWYSCPENSSIVCMQAVFCFSIVTNSIYSVKTKDNSVRVKVSNGTLSLVRENSDSFRLSIFRTEEEARRNSSIVMPININVIGGYDSKKMFATTTIVSVFFTLCQIFCRSYIGMYREDVDKIIYSTGKLWRNS